MATQAALDPITSVLLGVFAFEGTIHDSAWAPRSLAGFVAMVAGIVVLAASQQEEAEPAQPA